MMVKIPEKNCPTLEAVDRAIEEKNALEPPRQYLGMSSIGDPCARKLWYRLNGRRESFKAGTLRIFAAGHRAESVMAEYLRMVPGVELHTVNENGKQFAFSDLEGRYCGNMDGSIRGILQAPKTWHVWEHKEVNEKKFNELKKLKATSEKKALQKWDGVYYAQGVSYMYYSGMDRHFLTVSTPGVRDYISVRTNSNDEMAAALRTKAERILNAKAPPERIGGKDYYICKWCPFYGECHA